MLLSAIKVVIKPGKEERKPCIAERGIFQLIFGRIKGFYLLKKENNPLSEYRNSAKATFSLFLSLPSCPGP